MLKGVAGDDTLRGGAGADTLEGGDGINVADYRDAVAGWNPPTSTGMT